jgi:alpha-L-fucosidase
VKKYQADWESLSRHNEAPEWFRDAKLGIYFHWGVYSVPAFANEWYPRWMHFEGREEYNHHLKTYGHPSEFGYHDFVPMFKAENFDADEWADLFQKAGARFAGPVAEHHDGFSMWDSEVSPWNVADRGPHKDITGLLAKALRKRGLRLITTFHHAKNLQRFDSIPSEKGGLPFENSHYPYFKGMPPASEDPELRLLYGNIPANEFHEKIWLGKLKEVIDKYQPDIIWFDYMLDKIPEIYQLEFCTYYLNRAEEWNKDVVIVRKQDDLPLELSVEDLEKSRKNQLDEKVWMTDETISKGSWCYTENLEIKNAKDVLHVLIDIVSKNGVLLLNISPKADGTIPDNQKEVLIKLGIWLDKYGEAIYGTRPWYTYGEGPTKEPEGHFRFHEEFLKIKYSEKDYRYTTKGDFVYTSILGWPGTNQELIFSAFAKDKLTSENRVRTVSLLGYEGDLEWSWDDSGLRVVTPSTIVDDMAVVFKVGF